MSACTFTPTDEQKAIAQHLKTSSDNLAIDAGAGTGKTSTLLYLVRDVLPKGGILLCVFNRSNKQDIEGKLTSAGITFKDASAKTFDGLAFSLFKNKYPRFSQSEPDSGKYSTLARWWVKRNLPHTHTPMMRKTASKFLEKLFHFWVCNTTRSHKDNSLKLFVGGSLAFTEGALFPHELQNAHLIAQRYELDLDYDEVGDTDRPLLQVIEADYERLIEKGLPDLVRLGRLAFHEPMTVAAELVDDDGDSIYDGLASGKVWASFQDMSYWSVVEGWKPWQSKIVMVDEAQDLSPLQRALVNSHILPRGGRLIMVGDPQQAINAWNGADNDGFMNSQIFWGIKTVKPLSVCWRCCRSVVELAADWKTGFTPAPDAIEGTIANMHTDDVVKFIEDGDAIISRLRSQLVVWWRKMVKAGIPAKIVGQNPSEIVIRLLEKIADQKGFEYKHLKKHIDAYELAQIERLTSRKRPETELLAMQDEVETVRAMVEDVEAPTLEALIAKIKDELDPSKMPKNGVTILTGHTAKGGEWSKVFCVTPDKFPLTYRDQPDPEYVQECNLEYVMQTRAMRALFFVSKEYPHYDPNAPKPETAAPTITVARVPAEALPEAMSVPLLPAKLPYPVVSAPLAAYIRENGGLSPKPESRKDPYKGLVPLEGDTRDEEEPTKSPDMLVVDDLPDGEEEPVGIMLSPIGEKPEIKMLVIDDEDEDPAPVPATSETPYDLGTPAYYNQEKVRIVQVAGGTRNVQYVTQPHMPPYRWVNVSDLDPRERPALTTEPILLESAAGLPWMDQKYVSIGENSRNDQGAFDRAVGVARDLAGMDLWSGYSMIRIADPYGIHDRLEDSRYVTLSIVNGELLVQRAEAPAPAEREPEPIPEPVIASAPVVEKTPLPMPAPFRATGNLVADMKAKKSEAQARLYKVFDKLTTKDLEDLHSVIVSIIEDRQAEPA